MATARLKSTAEERRIASLQAQIDRLEEQLAQRLAAAETFGDEKDYMFGDGTGLVWFALRFEDGYGTYAPKTYTYAAVRCTNGLWYTTGGSRNNPQGAPWDQLVDWWLSNQVAEMWAATELSQVI